MHGDRAALRVDGIEGCDERWAVTPDKAIRLNNVRYDLRGGWERAGGTGKILQNSQGGAPFAGQGQVHSIHWFSEHNGGPQWLLWEMGAKLVYLNGSANSWVTLKTDRYTTYTPWQRSQYAATGNNCWIVNGYNEPIRFHYGVAHKAGFDAPAPPVIADGYTEGFTWGTSYRSLGLGEPGFGDGTFSDGEAGGGEYAYLLTEMNEFGTMSPPSPVYAAVKWQINATDLSRKNVNTKYFTRVRIPSPSGDHVMRRLLWRTKNLRGLGVQDGVRYYLCAELQGAGSFPHVDALPDQYLGRELKAQDIGLFPAGAKHMAIFKSHAWYAGMPNDPDCVYRSEAFDYENVPAANRYPIGNADSGEIVGMRETSNCLIVYKRRGIFMIMDDGPNHPFVVKTVTLEVGCAAPNSIRDVPEHGQFFAADDGVYVLIGSYQQGSAHVDVKRYSDSLADFWRWRVNRSALMNAWAVVNHLEAQYMLSVPIDGAVDNKMCLVFHYTQGGWTFSPDMNAACMTETHDHRSQVYIGSNDDTSHPGVHAISPWYTTYDGTTLTVSAESPWISATGGYAQMTPTTVLVRCVGYGDPAYSLTFYKNRRQTLLNTAQSRYSTDPEYENDKYDRWGAGLWDTSALWERAQPTTVRFDVGQASNKMREFKFNLSNSGRAQIIGFRVDAGVGPEQKQLNSVLGTGVAE